MSQTFTFRSLAASLSTDAIECRAAASLARTHAELARIRRDEVRARVDELVAEALESRAAKGGAL